MPLKCIFNILNVKTILSHYYFQDLHRSQAVNRDQHGIMRDDFPSCAILF